MQHKRECQWDKFFHGIDGMYNIICYNISCKIQLSLWLRIKHNKDLSSQYINEI